MKLSAILKIPIFLALLVFWFACSKNSTEPVPTVETPALLDDGWEVASLESQGISSQRISWISNRIAAVEFGEIHSMLIVRHGRLVFEQYYRDTRRDDLHVMFSVTKSVASALIGIALEKGFINSLDQTLGELFPEHAAILDADSLKKSVTLQQLLTMTGGLEWDEWTFAYSDSRNDASRMARRSDWIRFVLERPINTTPGSQFVYNSGISVLLSGIIRNTSELQADEFAARYLFGPLGITEHSWERQSDGLVNTGWGLSLRSRDLAKFGQLYLNNGVWNGEQVIASQWIQETIAPHAEVWEGVHYGYQWWLRQLPVSDGHVPQRNDIFHGHGYGGQFVFVIPKLDMVVVFTSGNFNADENSPIGLLYEGIIDAVVD